MLHSEIEFDGVDGKVSVIIKPSGEETLVLVKAGGGSVQLYAAELEHAHRLLQAYRAAQEAAVKALGGET